MSRPMSYSVLVASAAFAALCATSPAAAHDSWGKPDIGFAEYRIDAQECSDTAFHTNLWLEPIERVFRASYHYTMDIYGYARAHDIARHGVTATIVEQLQNAVDLCLIDRGYQRFRLTEAQNRQLGRFHRDTIERAQFLHRLASDPAVMAAQAIPTVRPPAPPAEEGILPTPQSPVIVPASPRPI